jgi:hypothetical protein
MDRCILPKSPAGPANSTTQPFFLIVIDEDRGVFSVEGPMTDNRPSQGAAHIDRQAPTNLTLVSPTVRQPSAATMP